jgi:hypothetical protein
VPICGDSIVSVGEVCDDGGVNCKPDCTGLKDPVTSPAGANGTTATPAGADSRITFLLEAAPVIAQVISYATTALIIASVPSLGPQMFISAGANLIIKSLPFMSTFHNIFSEEFLRKGSQFFSFDFIPLSIFDLFNIKESEYFVILDSSKEMKDIGLSTYTSLMSLFIKIFQSIMFISGLAFC